MGPTDQTDDFPSESWLHVRVLDGDTPKGVRMRAALKCLLRSFGIRVVRLTGEVPAGAEIGAEAGPGAIYEPAGR